MIFLGLGSNIGNREENIETAIRNLSRNPNITVVHSSSLYETEPVGYIAQASFLNAVVQIDSSLSPHTILTICQETETKMGRERAIHWGPRTIDIDLLSYDGAILNTPDLILPHPFLAERRFVLIPLAEISNSVILDDFTAKDLLIKCKDHSEVRIYKTKFL
jgi:2-amino-4-hydroxy-6-hydroxymethyldihydropteridine diphosphokinase